MIALSVAVAGSTNGGTNIAVCAASIGEAMVAIAAVVAGKNSGGTNIAVCAAIGEATVVIVVFILIIHCFPKVILEW